MTLRLLPIHTPYFTLITTRGQRFIPRLIINSTRGQYHSNGTTLISNLSKTAFLSTQKKTLQNCEKCMEILLIKFQLFHSGHLHSMPQHVSIENTSNKLWKIVHMPESCNTHNPMSTGLFSYFWNTL